MESRFDGPERRLCGLIWLLPDQKYLWTRFYDVVFLDTTSRTNKYNMVACFFVVIDNCNRSRLVASALLEDEAEDSFIWTLKMINKCTGDLIPQVIFTDSDLAIASAIRSEFPISVHCLCLFHIDLNIKKNLRNKLNSSEFMEFRKDFFICRNTLVAELFESHWEALKSKYVLAESYIKRQLDPSKTKWAVCYINKQFTAGANSTQRVENLNRKIHSCVGSNSSLLELVKEIQDLLDKESDFMRLEEYKDEIPMVGLATIPKTFFNSIEATISRYLMPVIVFKICKQMQECFFYDCIRISNIDLESILQEPLDTDYSEGMREDNYEVMKNHLNDMVETVGRAQIMEVWKLVMSGGIKSQYIILVADGSHICTCNLLITHGYPCRHFYKILRCSSQAKWHIGLIASR